MNNLVEQIYSLYPRKEGKAAGFKKLAKMSDDKLQQILIAVNNYNLKLKINSTPKQYTLLFSTFVNGRWEDYLEVQPEETVPSSPLLNYLKPLALDMRFSRHSDLVNRRWSNEESFLNYLTNLKTYYIRTNEIESVSPESESFRGFVAVCISKELGL